jgi:hypothetical protein
MSATRRDVERLLAMPNENPIELAMRLAELEVKEPGSIELMAENTRVSRRKLYYLVNIWRTLGHIPASRLAAIGWTKASIIAQHFKASEEGEDRDALVSQALSHAEHYTAKELPAILNDEPPKPKAHSIHLRLTPRQYAVFAAAMLEYGAKPMKRGRGFGDKEKTLTKALRALAGGDR